MKNVNWFLKILSVTLVFALCFTMFASVPVSAVNIQVQADNSLLPGDLTPEELKAAELDSEDIPEILRDEEIEEKDHVNRLYEQEDSLNSVMFQNRDGTKTKYLYNTPVKYVDDKGETQDKSNAIYTTLFGNFETRENDITSYFPKKINGNKGVEISFKEYTVEMSPDIKGNSGASRQTGHNKYGDPTDYVQYPDVFDEGIAVRYTPTFDGLKEDIILEEYTGINEFTFILRTDGLKLFLDENGIPKLSDPETNEVLADLGALYIYDSGEPELFGDWNHKYILKTVEENKEYKLTVSVDEDYLTDPERVYPVHVDPNIYAVEEGYSKTIMDAPVYDGRPNERCGSYIYGVVGYDTSYGTGRLLMKFPALATDSQYTSLSADQIFELTLNFFEGSGNTNPVSLDSYLYIGTDWEEATVTKNTMGWESFINYVSTASVSTQGWYTFDLTFPVELWKSNWTDLNKGIIIKNSTGEEHPAFAKTICMTESGYKPYLSYTYIPYIPVEGIDLMDSALILDVGETLSIRASVVPFNATNQSITLSSSNSSVVMAFSNTKSVYANTPGTAIVTIRSAEDPNIFETCYVVVRDIFSNIISDLSRDEYYYLVYPSGIGPHFLASNMPESPVISTLTWDKKLLSINISRKYSGYPSNSTTYAALRDELNSTLGTNYSLNDAIKIYIEYGLATMTTPLSAGGMPPHLYTPESVQQCQSDYISTLHTLTTLVTYKIAANLNPFDANGNIKFKPDPYINYGSSGGHWNYPPNDGFLDNTKESITLKRGDIISRYGDDTGHFASPDGTPFSMRSLPPDTDLSNLHRYVVLEDTQVYGGIAAPWFYQPGGGVQYMFEQPIEYYLSPEVGCLQELF